MMQAEDGSSELDDDDFLGGLSPQDESTPLNLSRGKSLLVRQPEQSPSPSESLPSSGGSRKRKRPEEIQVPESPSERTQEIVQDSQNETPVPRERERDQESHVSERTIQAQSPAIFSQTMAPPASSPLRSTQGSTAGAPRSPSVVPRKVSGNTKPKDPSHLSTAALQDRLLPRRRQRRRKHRPADGAEGSSDESDDGMHDAASGDDDELSYLPSKPRRGQSSKPKPLSHTRDKSKTNKQKQKKTTKSGSAAKPSGPATYSQARKSSGVDKENEQHMSSPSSSPLSSPPDSDASDSDVDAEPARRYMSEELRAAAKKFAEVDQWQMEFEEVSASEAQASPAR